MKVRKGKIHFIFLMSMLVASLIIPQSVGFAVEVDNADDYLHVSGNRILDIYGNEVRLSGIAWFGFETSNKSYHGLWANKLENILDIVADNGFNLLRVPLCVELVNQWRQGVYPMPDSINTYVSPELEGVNSLQLLDKSIAYCKKIGLKVMFDMHRIVNSGQSNTWYSGDYTAEDFEECWKWLAEHYKNDDTIIAMDIFNEPHGKTYHNEVAAKWDDSTDQNNWKYEAEKVGKAILEINPHLLIVVEGNEVYPKEGYTYEDKNVDQYYNTWWGGNLRGVLDHPIDLGDGQEQLVYSPHDYGPSVSQQPWFVKDFNKETLLNDVWRPNWFYIHENEIAPILIGEWGGKMDNGDNEKWMNALAKLIYENKLHHIFWCLNPNSGDTGGILDYDFKTIDTEKLALVQPTLWKNENSDKFIGLDHQVNLGKNGTHVSTRESKLLGDINSDGSVNSLDYILFKRYLLGYIIEININIWDLNNDEKVNSLDMIILKKIILNS